MLDCSSCALEKILHWLDRVHVVVIDPGLGHDAYVPLTAIRAMQICQKFNKPLVIDANGLSILSEHTGLLKDMKNIIFTPNLIEYKRLFGDNDELVRQLMSSLV